MLSHRFQSQAIQMSGFISRSQLVKIYLYGREATYCIHEQEGRLQKEEYTVLCGKAKPGNANLKLAIPLYTMKFWILLVRTED